MPACGARGCAPRRRAPRASCPWQRTQTHLATAWCWRSSCDDPARRRADARHAHHLRSARGVRDAREHRPPAVGALPSDDPEAAHRAWHATSTTVDQPARGLGASVPTEHVGPAPAGRLRSAAGGALHRRGHPVVRHAVRPRFDHHGPPDAVHADPRSHATRCRSWRVSRRPSRTTGGTPSRARSSTSCAPGSWRGPRDPAHAVLRLGGRDALWLVLLRRVRALDRRLGAGRPAVADRSRGARAGSTGTATSTATASWSTTGAPGGVCSTRAGRTPRDAIRWADGRLAEGPIALVEVQGYVYRARREMARLARRRGDEALADRQEAAASDLRDAVRGRASGWRTPAPTRSRSTARSGGRQRHLQRGSCAVDRHRARRNAPTRVAASLLGPEHVQRLGHPDAVRRDGGLQPHQLSHRQRLAARQRHLCRRDVALRLSRGGARVSRPRCWRRPSTSATRGCPSCSAASTGQRRRTRCRTRRVLAPGMGVGRIFQLLAAMLGLAPDARDHELQLRNADAAPLAARGAPREPCRG